MTLKTNLTTILMYWKTKTCSHNPEINRTSGYMVRQLTGCLVFGQTTICSTCTTWCILSWNSSNTQLLWFEGIECHKTQIKTCMCNLNHLTGHQNPNFCQWNGKAEHTARPCSSITEPSWEIPIQADKKQLGNRQKDVWTYHYKNLMSS